MAKNFTKMHALHNTFIVMEGSGDLTSKQIAKYAQSFGEKQSDGVVVISAERESSFVMHYWDGDGTRAEMCGNGLRCAVRYAVKNGLVEPGQISVKTDVGILKANWNGKDVDNIQVQVGKVVVDDKSVKLHGRTFYKANVGNPHAVTFVEDVKNAPVEEIGNIIEHDKHFPHRTNVEFVKVIDPNSISLRVWERNTGETMACGTGMAAAANAAAFAHNVQFPMHVSVPGGSAELWIDDSGFTCMGGPARFV